MEKIDFEDIRVGDRIEAHRIYGSGDLSVCRLTVLKKTEYVMDSDAFTFGRSADVEYFIYSGYRVFHKIHSDRESLTFERVQMPEPKKIGTVVEYMWNGSLTTAVLFTLRDVARYPWIRSDGYTLSWDDILASDPNPKIKEG